MDQETFRLSCLQLAIQNFTEINEDEILDIAKKFAAFVLTDDVPVEDA